MKFFVNAYQCTKCHDIVFSRCRHDMRYCSCGSIAVDGGFDYTKISYKSPDDIISMSKFIEIDGVETVPDMKKILYEDWNKRIDKYGREKLQSTGQG